MEENKESENQTPVKTEVEKKTTDIKIEKPKKPGIFNRIGSKLIQYRRVLDVSKKPDKEEFVSSVKITSAGIALIGIIGFIIFIVYFLVVP